MNASELQGWVEIISAAEAKARLSELIRRTEAGERFVITKHGKPVAELSKPKISRPKKRLRGAMRGELWMAPDFDELGPEWDEYIR